MNKKLTLTSFVVIIITALIYLSCSKENDNTGSEPTSLRESFINNSTESQQKIAFQKLSDKDKASLWIEKMNHLKNLNLPNEHISLINDLLNELTNNGYLSNQNNSETINITKKLFEITPAEDLKSMFFSLNDYSYPGNFDLSSGYLNFTDSNSNLQKISKSVNNKTNTEECTCRWTCSESGHTNCTETNVGCGLLWLWSCTRRLT